MSLDALGRLSGGGLSLKRTCLSMLKHVSLASDLRAVGRTAGAGGEGGIRTPDSLATMSDFESGAFNRALPPLRFGYNDLEDALDCAFVALAVAPGTPRPCADSLQPSLVYRRSVPDAMPGGVRLRTRAAGCGTPCRHSGGDCFRFR